MKIEIQKIKQRMSLLIVKTDVQWGMYFEAYELPIQMTFLWLALRWFRRGWLERPLGWVEQSGLMCHGKACETCPAGVRL